MNQPSVHKKFIFNQKIDHDWLYSLYEDDYAYIAEVFGSSIDAFREDLPALSTAFEASDIQAVRKAAHKLKPVLGFAGLLQHQETMLRFENACGLAKTSGNLTMQYIELMESMQEAKNILQEEYNRLTAFIS